MSGMPDHIERSGLKHNVAATDAEVVKRLRAAGANRRQDQRRADARRRRSNEPVVRSDPRPVEHRSCRQVDLAVISAAAVAASLSCLDIGSDLGGSIRIPSAMCGVYGFDRTPALCRLPARAPESRPRQCSIPLSRLARLPAAPVDIRLSLRALAGPVAPSGDSPRIGTVGAAPRQLRDSGWRVVSMIPTAELPARSAPSCPTSSTAWPAGMSRSAGWPRSSTAHASQGPSTHDRRLPGLQFGGAVRTRTLVGLIGTTKRTSLQARSETYLTDLVLFGGRGVRRRAASRRSTYRGRPVRRRPDRAVQRPRRVDRPCVRRWATGM